MLEEQSPLLLSASQLCPVPKEKGGGGHEYGEGVSMIVMVLTMYEVCLECCSKTCTSSLTKVAMLSHLL